ncbi:hypothetical protein D3C83_311960 [compost metagenome]
MRVSHFCDAEPGQPGATSRAGKPCTAGSGWPLTAKARIVCSSIALAIGTPREIDGFVASPDRCGSAP